MGCCLSAGKVRAPPVAAAADQTPPTIEEETVKEVVVQSVSVSVPDPIPVPDIVPSVPEVSDSEAHRPPPSLLTPEISHSKSDICSVSHSFSTATTATAASILEDDALSKPHRPLPPPSSSRRNISDRVSRSPGGRHSPQGKLRPRLVRERPSNQPNPIHNRRNVDSGPLPRSGLLEGPRRRSRSPATRGPSSARRSPMKKREPAPVRDGAEVKKEEAKVAVEVKKEEEDVAVRDPEVSMECFIFL
ncbi:hypothetical protein EUTSA_v10026095mg [Eutrema salsugineum]|uniref:Uncharacterized protein n=1 Tax=Eutrema salsugineum TaxID=72664 RepID=V4MDA3_EUTSA|nr:uncharacterized protein LOC18028831 [Eutrema salsugineum]ESQ54439.1 hypothetical protein EUTSA_v10026095mg [Eutrema salsugineum]